MDFNSQALDKQAFVRAKAAENALDPEQEKVVWAFHAVAKLRSEQLKRRDVEGALTRAQMIEDYPQLTRPLPDGLFLGYLDNGSPIHAVVAIDEAKDRVLVVTVYRPCLERWENDWKTRRNQG